MPPGVAESLGTLELAMRVLSPACIALIAVLAASWQSLKDAPLKLAVVGTWSGMGKWPGAARQGTLQFGSDGRLDTNITHGVPPPGEAFAKTTIDGSGRVTTTYWQPPPGRHTVGNWRIGDSETITARLTLPSDEELVADFRPNGATLVMTGYRDGEGLPLADLTRDPSSPPVTINPPIWLVVFAVSVVSVTVGLLVLALGRRYPPISILLITMLLSFVRLAIHPLVILHLPGSLGVKTISDQVQIYRDYQIADTIVAAVQVVLILIALYLWWKTKRTATAVVPGLH
jgi:hypothetical protein